MIGNFKTILNGTEFQFQTMNVKRLQLFQVYVLREGKKMRFHMQRKGEGDFYTTDPDKVPEPYKLLAQELDEVIMVN
jgi:hypothetical protein